MRLEALEIRGFVDHTIFEDSIEVMLSVSENGEAMTVGEFAALIESIDVTLSVSENEEPMVDGEFVAIV